MKLFQLLRITKFLRNYKGISKSLNFNLKTKKKDYLNFKFKTNFKFNLKYLNIKNLIIDKKRKH